MLGCYSCAEMKVVGVLSLLLSLVIGLKHNLDIEKDDRHLFKVETFGFYRGGKIDIAFHDFQMDYPASMSKADIDKSILAGGFVMRRQDSESAAQQDLEELIEKDTCVFNVLGPSDVSLPLSFNSNYGRLEMTVENPGLYTLMFQRCDPKTSDYKVNFHLDAMFKNRGTGKAAGMEWNYLSAGDAPLPVMYSVFFVLFFLALLVWVSILRRDPAEHGQVSKLHYLMCVLLVLKVCTLLFESIRYHYISIYGVPQFWDDIYLFFAAMKGAALFVTIALIGTGWSILKGFLNDWEKRIILSVLVLQVICNVALIVVEETSPGSVFWLEWRDIFHLVDITCCVAILFPIIWSIKRLREASEVDGKAQSVLAKLRIFRSFYIITVAYIYSTRILVFLLAATVPYYFLWLGALFSESITLAFYVTTGYMFKPGIENAYLAVRSEDGGEDEEFGLLGDSDDEAEAAIVSPRAPHKKETEMTAMV